MIITLTPIRHDIPLIAERMKDRLILNGVPVDMASPGECSWILGQPEQREGRWHVMLLVPHGADAPPETLFPAPVVLTGDGPVPLPPYSRPEATDVSGTDPS